MHPYATRLSLLAAFGAASLQGCFAPLQCGDGIVQNNENCDDGNTDDNDFCRNDCSTGPLLALEGITIKNVDGADVLLVVDDSGSMSEEHINFMGQLQGVIDDLGGSNVPLRFATVTSDADANPAGNFFTNPQDIINGAGQLIRDIPEAFCQGVMANSNGGVVENTNQNLLSFIQGFGPIPDFTAREFGVFQDANGDKVADNLITPTFVDAVGCLLAVGIRGSGSEVALCQAAAALDPASLFGSNSGLLSSPNSVLGIVVISDEDDCTESITEQGGEFICSSLALNNQTGSLRCAQSTSEEICNTGQTGQFENLTNVDLFVDRIKSLRDEDHLYAATISGPPAAALDDCERLLPVPSCNNPSTGSASPGNRYFDFVNQFENRSDAIESSICGDSNSQAFSLSPIRTGLTKTVDFDCLNTNVSALYDLSSFDANRNLKIRVDLTETTLSCADLGSIASETEEGCLLSPTAAPLVPKSGCGGGFELNTEGLGLPFGTRLSVEFRR